MLDNEYVRSQLRNAVEEGLQMGPMSGTPRSPEDPRAGQLARDVALEQITNEYRIVLQSALCVLETAAEIMSSMIQVISRVEASGFRCETPVGHWHELQLRRLGFLVYIDIALDNDSEVQSFLVGSLVPLDMNLICGHDLERPTMCDRDSPSGGEAIMRAFLARLQAFVSNVARLSGKGR